jgi:hypothetical protein
MTEIKIENIKIVDVGEKGSDRKRIDFYLNDWKEDGSMLYLMVVPDMIYWNSIEGMLLGALRLQITKEHNEHFNFNSFLKAVQSKTSSSPSRPVAATEPSGKIEKVWLEHNVYNNGEKGMNIHCHFSIDGMKGKKAVLCAFIRDSNDKSITFQCNGQSNGGSIIPSYDRSEYRDFVISLNPQTFVFT